MKAPDKEKFFLGAFLLKKNAANDKTLMLQLISVPLQSNYIPTSINSTLDI
jgi:hypothetical protein